MHCSTHSFIQCILCMLKLIQHNAGNEKERIQMKEDLAHIGHYNSLQLFAIR